VRQPGYSKTRESIYSYIKKFFRNRGYAPTVRDILKGCSISSTAVVQHHLNVLEREGRIHRDPEVFRSIQLTVYALKVKGLSMIDALIDDGDIVLMEPVNSAENGDMVAVWLKNEQEVTLKKFYLEDGIVCLRPANQTMKPIYQDAENVEVQGKVAAVIRKL